MSSGRERVSEPNLALLDRIDREINAIRTLNQVKKIDGDLAALEEWARTRQLPLEDQNRVVEARALVQFKGGNLVAAIPEGEPGRGRIGGKVRTLRDFGIADRSAGRWVLLTKLENGEETIRTRVAERTRAGQSVTLGYFYGLAKPARKVVNPPGFPEGPFRTIVLDPPWPIAKIPLNRRPVERESLDYGTQALEAIERLPVPLLAHSEGAHIYLWVTHRHLPIGLQLFEKWGVRYECVITWVKPTAQPLWWAYTTEHALFGKIGSLALNVKGRPVHFTAPQQRHSHKPEAFFDLVRTVSPDRRLTMYDEDRKEFERWGEPHEVDR